MLKKYRMSNRDDFPMAGRHIHFLRIRAFVSEGIDFTEEETAHFDECFPCRLKVVDALRNLASGGPPVCDTTKEKAA